MDEIPYTTLMYLNAVVPSYNSDSDSGDGEGSSIEKPNKRMSLWDIQSAVVNKKGV